MQWNHRVLYKKKINRNTSLNTAHERQLIQNLQFNDEWWMPSVCGMVSPWAQFLRYLRSLFFVSMHFSPLWYKQFVVISMCLIYKEYYMYCLFPKVINFDAEVSVASNVQWKASRSVLSVDILKILLSWFVPSYLPSLQNHTLWMDTNVDNSTCIHVYCRKLYQHWYILKIFWTKLSIIHKHLVNICIQLSIQGLQGLRDVLLKLAMICL